MDMTYLLPGENATVVAAFEMRVIIGPEPYPWPTVRLRTYGWEPDGQGGALIPLGPGICGVPVATYEAEYVTPVRELGVDVVPHPANPAHWRRWARVPLTAKVDTPPYRYWCEAGARAAAEFVASGLPKAGRKHPHSEHEYTFCGFESTHQAVYRLVWFDRQPVTAGPEEFPAAVAAWLQRAHHPAGCLLDLGMHPNQGGIDGMMGRPAGIHS